MTPHYTDDWLTIYSGDSREVLATLPADSVDCVVTSPPYWGLRDYGSDGQLGLERTPEEYVANMVAVFREVRRVLKPSGTCWLNLGDSYAGSWGAQSREKDAPPTDFGEQWTSKGDDFTRSLSKRQIEAHPKRTNTGSWVNGRTDLKPKDLVGIPWRVAFALQADGWVLRSEIIWNKPNPMPESVTDRPTKSHEQLFLLTKAKRVGPEPTKYDDISDADAQWIAGLLDCEGSIVIRREQPTSTGQQHAAQVSIGSTSRELMERLAAVVGEGSVLERPGQNAPMHYWQQSGKRALGLLRRLYPFLIVKQRQARCAIALEERKWVRGGHKQLPASEIQWREMVWQAVKSLNHFGDPDLSAVPEPKFGRWVPERYYFDVDAVREPHVGPLHNPGNKTDNGRLTSSMGHLEEPDRVWGNVGGRNVRSVWTIATRPYPGAHFAVFPPELPERCIKAGSSEKGVCPECGAPWERILQREGGERYATGKSATKNGAGLATAFSGYTDGSSSPTFTTLGWRPTCDHGAEPIPSVTLDPFAGSGTTGMVAQKLGRRAVLIDLNPEYLKQQMQRNAQTPLGLDAA